MDKYRIIILKFISLCHKDAIKMKKLIYIVFVIIFIWSCQSPSPDELEKMNKPNTKLSEEQLKQVKTWMDSMSLDDKVSLVVGMGFDVPGMVVAEQKERVPGAAGSTYSVSDIGLPSMVLADGPAGLRILPIRDSSSTKRYYCTAFPIATLLASTWDTELVVRVGQAYGDEIKEYGVDILLAPAMNIHRNPLAGRNFEYYSEDPLVSGKMAAAMVNGVESKGVGTSIKHFVANNSETNRMSLNTHVSQRALREIYLKGFEIAIKESQPWTVMSSYNKINGTYTSESRELLTTILRDDWGFEGFVMTDWFGGADAVAQMNAGNDLLMPGTPQQRDSIRAGIESGELPIEVLNTNVERILKAVVKSPIYQNYNYSDKPDLKANAQLAREVAAEGTILLKNADNTLPITSENLKAATFGVGSYQFIAGGTGSGDVNEAYTISLVEGLENAGIELNTELKNMYTSYMEEEKAKQPKDLPWFMTPPPIPEMKLDESVIGEMAQKSDIAFITIGRNSGEFADRKQEGDYYLTAAEKSMIETVSERFHAENKKVIILLNIGNVIEMVSWRDYADAIVLAWQGGQEAGNALTDVLTGKVNPSGKLTTTFTNTYDDVPSSATFPGSEVEGGETRSFGFMELVESEITYDDGILVGYRYYDTKNVDVAYPFGYGLSYTSFDYSNLQLSSSQFNEELIASVTVTNTGDVPGKESVQLYVKAPKGSIDKPNKELRAFAKTGLLQPGGSEKLNMVLKARDLSSFDESMNAWVVEAGTYEVLIGASSKDILVKENFNNKKLIIVEKVSDVLAPTQDLLSEF